MAIVALPFGSYVGDYVEHLYDISFLASQWSINNVRDQVKVVASKIVNESYYKKSSELEKAQVRPRS